jgi:hypothetical protein
MSATTIHIQKIGFDFSHSCSFIQKKCDSPSSWYFNDICSLDICISDCKISHCFNPNPLSLENNHCFNLIPFFLALINVKLLSRSNSRGILSHLLLLFRIYLRKCLPFWLFIFLSDACVCLFEVVILYLLFMGFVNMFHILPLTNFASGCVTMPDGPSRVLFHFRLVLLNKKQRALCRSCFLFFFCFL